MPEQQDLTAVKEVGAQQQAKGRILVVEDEEMVGTMLELWMHRDGYSVQRAASFEQACVWMGKETFDLVTLDIVMPVVGGMQALRWFREYHPEVGVVMATGLGNLNLILESMRLGAYSYVTKPFNMEQLSRELARAMERQRAEVRRAQHQRQLELKVEEQARQLEAAHASLAAQLREREGQQRLIRCQIENPTSQTVCQAIMEALHQVMEVEAAVLYQPAGAPEGLKAVAVLDRTGQVIMAGPTAIQGAALAAQAWRDRQALARPGEGSAWPLSCQGKVLGVLWIKGLNGTAPGEQYRILWRLSSLSALALWVAQMKEGPGSPSRN